MARIYISIWIGHMRMKRNDLPKCLEFDMFCSVLVPEHMIRYVTPRHLKEREMKLVETRAEEETSG